MVYISGGNELLDAEKILKHLGVKSGLKVADLGCGGAGHFIIPAAKKVGEQGVAYAVDILKSVLHSVSSRARLEGVNNIRTVWSNLETAGATRIPAKSLDFVFLINILFQSKQHKDVFKEASRLLKKNGKILVIDWQSSKAAFGPPAADRVDPKDIKDVAKEFDLKLIDDFTAGNYHYGLIFQKP